MGQEHAFSEGTNGSVTVGATSTLVLAPKSGRLYALLINDSDETIYLGMGTDAVMNKGIRLSPYGGAIELDGDQPFKGAVRAICASGSKNLTYFEA